MSNIEWTDKTWNPIIGCRHVAEGCRNCYAETMSKRLAAMGQADYASILTPAGKFNGKAITRPDTLAEPLKWRKPRMVFVNSMSDLFHEDVPFEFIAAVYGVMAARPQHTFQVLTKRPARMLEFFEWVEVNALDVCATKAMDHLRADAWAIGPGLSGYGTVWPLPNVWHGVSVAEQKDADRNIPILLQVPSAIRFVSAEPLIGPVRLDHMDVDATSDWCQINALTGRHADMGRPCPDVPKLDWVIAGGESGPGARPCDVAWIRSIVEQCKAAGVACFVKQVGSNVIDRNDVGWDATTHRYTDAPENGDLAGKPVQPKAWPDHIVDEDRVEHDIHGYRDEWQGADVRVRLDGKGGKPEDWPQDLRVREFPTAINRENTKAQKGAGRG